MSAEASKPSDKVAGRTLLTRSKLPAAVTLLIALLSTIAAFVRLESPPPSGDATQRVTGEPAPFAETQEHHAAAQRAAPPAVRGVPPPTADELQAMSQTFRHTSLLIAIRQAGFVCDEVVAAHQTGRNVWTASCGDMRGYSIEIAASRVTVRAIPQYFDNVGPLPALEPIAPQERLPQQ